MYPHDKNCPTDITSPEPVGVCDLCYQKFYLSELFWLFDFRGNNLQNLRLRVCRRDLDVPADQLRPIIIVGAEGVVRDPRPPQYAANAAGGTTPPTSAELSEIFDDMIPP